MLTRNEKVLYDRAVAKGRASGMGYLQIREGAPSKTPRGSTRRVTITMWGENEKHWAQVVIESTLPEDMAFVAKVSTEVDEWTPGSFRDWSEII